ncbi:uncharacterized protein N7503_009735 [Penicillium pulvis]|uniref:uncharacterized protein n=1 Tax=Penicillium pulvis TaxID=1562058 RepID=UPI0025489F72|nr:uncharacterized protein N7503_009735 [Penicillium pulvis]KAJ5784523.1 hypothetical protein N7503_009735 [Penicillium pulvis]
MDSLRFRRKAVPASLNMDNHERFYPTKTFVHRRVSGTGTNFDDTDIEDSDSDEEFLRQSMQSLAYDSNTTLSSPDLQTPDEIDKNTVSILLDKSSLVRGPNGPHLFRDSRGSSIYEPSTAEIDLYFERSPLQTEFSRSIDTPNRFPFSPNTPNRFPFSPKTPKAFTTVHPDVSQVDEEEIRTWKPSQVAHWLYIAGYNDAVIEKFILNDITGGVLLSLQIDDLKELSITSFGIRHQVMASINHLKDTMHKGGPLHPDPPLSGASISQTSDSQNTLSHDQYHDQYHAQRHDQHDDQHHDDSHDDSSHGRSSPERRSYAMTVSPTGDVLYRGIYGQIGNQVTPAESVSIVGIEQLLPKPHSCSKGENCSKFRRRQRKIEKLKAEFPDAFVSDGAMITGSPGNPQTAMNMLRPTSDAQPSVAASSGVFGPGRGPRLSEAALSEVQKLDPREAVRNFLSYQNVDESKHMLPGLDTTNLPPAGNFGSYSPPEAQPNNMAANLRSLPKLHIPTSPNTEEMTTAVTTNPRSMSPNLEPYGSPTAIQRYGPFTQANEVDVYRQGTPFSEMDVPITAIPTGPIARDASQSVPPDMRYRPNVFPNGTLFPSYRDPIARSASARPRAGSNLRRVDEDKPLPPIEVPADLIRSPRLQQHGHSASLSELASDPDVTHAGYMKKRNKTRLLHHEWQEAHFTLRGTNLAMHKDESEAHRISRALENINVDDYAVACQSLATGSKLSAGFKKTILRRGSESSKDDSAFAFSLIPATRENEKKALFGNKDGIKTHRFAVKTREERIDWMRELMLARALKKGKERGEEVLVNGNMI